MLAATPKPPEKDAMAETDSLFLTRMQVIADWVDYNDHLNDAFYALIFSRSGDALLEHIGLGAAERAATGRTIFTTDLIIHYLNEVKLGQSVDVSCRILEADGKRIRIWFEMAHPQGGLAATSEQIYLCIDQTGEKPRAASWPEPVGAAIAALATRHAATPPPEAAGRGISLKRRG